MRFVLTAHGWRGSFLGPSALRGRRAPLQLGGISVRAGRTPSRRGLEGRSCLSTSGGVEAHSIQGCRKGVVGPLHLCQAWGIALRVEGDCEHLNRHN
jgi:hypothetical protein